MDPRVLLAELKACGLQECGTDCNGNIHWMSEPSEGEKALAELVLAAHGKAASSDEIAQIMNRIDPEKGYPDAYVEARKQPVAEERRQRYTFETDSMFAKAFELASGAKDIEIDGVRVRVPASEKMQEWESAKEKIRAALPYPE